MHVGLAQHGHCAVREQPTRSAGSSSGLQEGNVGLVTNRVTILVVTLNTDYPSSSLPHEDRHSTVKEIPGHFPSVFRGTCFRIGYGGCFSSIEDVASHGISWLAVLPRTEFDFGLEALWLAHTTLACLEPDRSWFEIPFRNHSRARSTNPAQALL